MIAYLDTNVVVWLAENRLTRVSQKALDILEHADLLISPMILLELEYLSEIKRIRLTSREVQLKVEHECGVRVCDFSFSSVANIAVTEKWTRDPFDRMIVAHAKANGLAFLVSANGEVANNYPRTVW